MGFRCGIVGLPNAGKSTLFNAMTAAGAEVASYPFSTLSPNVGVVAVPDPRLQRLAALFSPRQAVPTTVQFVDIAGLVKGASRGEGLGNQFLAHIREVDALVHVVRCFRNPDVAHVEGTVDPLRDVEIVETELLLADLETLERRVLRLERQAKGGDRAVLRELGFLKRLRDFLDAGSAARQFQVSGEEKAWLRSCHLLTAKPVLYVANLSEADLGREPEAVGTLRDMAQRKGAQAIALCAAVEAELAALEPGERKEYLEALGLEASGLDRLIRAGHALLGLITFFTVGDREVRAWTVPRGTRAPQAAGRIHTDMERGFIRAEVIRYEDLVTLGSLAAVREKGLLRWEGKDYKIQDGDVVQFRFHVTRETPSRSS